MGDKIDTQANRYELGRQIGVGGMAEVYEATLRGVHGFTKLVALKRILPRIAQQPAFVKRFIAEAKVTVGLAHSNIVSVLDFGHWEETLFMAMELVDGCDLDEALKRTDPRHGQEFFYTVAIALCRGIAHAHSKGVVHRDVSPSNILLSRSGDVKVADFGVAMLVGDNHDSIAAGKKRYAAPEQWLGVANESSDVYGIAAVLDDLRGATTLDGQAPWLPDDIDEIIENCRADDPESRTWSAKQLGEFLSAQAVAHNVILSPEAVKSRIPAARDSEVFQFAHKERRTKAESPGAKAEVLVVKNDQQVTRLQAASEGRGETVVRKRGMAKIAAGVLLLGAAAAAGGYWLNDFGQLAPTRPKAEIQVITNVPASIYVDERPLGPAPQLVSLYMAKHYKITARAPSYHTSEEVVTGGETDQVSLTLEPTNSTVIVRTVPRGAKVWIDDELVGMAPLVRDISQDSVVIRAGMDGYDNVEKAVSVDPGIRQEITLTLSREKKAVKKSIEFFVRDFDGQSGWGNVYLQGKLLGRVPGRISLPVGKHRLLVKNPVHGRRAWVSVRVRSAKNAPVNVRLAKSK